MAAGSLSLIITMVVFASGHGRIRVETRAVPSAAPAVGSVVAPHRTVVDPTTEDPGRASPRRVLSEWVTLILTCGDDGAADPMSRSGRESPSTVLPSLSLASPRQATISRPMCTFQARVCGRYRRECHRDGIGMDRDGLLC
jgi:hypothetical protein